jgi:hypothetical protein
MIGDRIFNRYQTSHLGIEVIFPSLKGAHYYLENASLNGIQIYGEGKIVTQDYNQVLIKLSSKETFYTNVFQVWREDEVELAKIKELPIAKHFKSDPFRTGLKLKFIEKEHYDKWLKFITALHTIHIKKTNQ